MSIVLYHHPNFHTLIGKTALYGQNDADEDDEYKRILMCI